MRAWKNAKLVLATGAMVVLIGVTAGYATPATVPVDAAPVGQQTDRSSVFDSYQEAVQGFASVAEEANLVVSETDGKVSDNTNRDALNVLAGELSDVVEPASRWLEGYGTLDGQAEESRLYPLFFTQYDSERAQELSDEIETASAAVQADHEAWAAEQERLRLEREAAERAATAARAEAERVAAAQVAAASRTSRDITPASSPGSPSGASTSGVAYTIRSLGAANQSVIDSCSGFGDTTGWLGVPSFSVHWHCGGSRIASLPVGAVVKIENGQYAGTWRFNGLAYRLNGQVNTTADIRQTGGLQIQTCLGGTYSNLGYFTLSRM